MQTPPPPLLPHPQPPEHQQQEDEVRASEMSFVEDGSPLFNWDELFDFAVDEDFFRFDADHASVDPECHQESPERAHLETIDRVRKRDPRLTCENFLAGLVPCSCPDVDEKTEEEEMRLSGKKRARTDRVERAARCQVPGCEADISEIKGYHRRHRVCLLCANASVVVLDGESKRYCQQCGKFHIVSDFDEGKRSCRRKLERHNNNRRRRKSNDSKESAEKEPQQDFISDDVNCDMEAGKDDVCLNNEKSVIGPPLDSEDGHVSTLSSAHGSQNITDNGFISSVASDETQMDGAKDRSKYALSSSYCDSKSSYSSLCPTGRISFKLYDWNPAEFPRRLRNQIFQWLGSMPVELEGYIRPGCTILTIYVAMPKFMWEKVCEDPVSYVRDIVIAPGKILSGRGCALVYLNNMMFRVLKGGTSLIKVDEKALAPKLHYVQPSCFEAGKPMEFFTCGSNLLQSKFRFLVSFDGKYLTSELNIVFPHDEAGISSGHQLYRIYVPHTDPNLLGPAFIEVENENGVSNFIPVLVGDKEICSEMKIIQQRYDATFCLYGSPFLANSCNVAVSRQMALSEFVLEIAWLLREPSLECIQSMLTSLQMQRYNHLLNFLIHNGSTCILSRVLKILKIRLQNVELRDAANGVNGIDIHLFKKHLDHASDILFQKLYKGGDSLLQCCKSTGGCFSQSFSQDKMLPGEQDMEIRVEEACHLLPSSSCQDENGAAPGPAGKVCISKRWTRKSCSPIFRTRNVLASTRPITLVLAAFIICCAICAVALHPQKVTEFAVTIRRCLFN